MDTEHFTGTGAIESVQSYFGDASPAIAADTRESDGHEAVAGGGAPRGEAGEVESPNGDAAQGDEAGAYVLDAWYAEFGDRWIVDALQRRKDVASALLREVVIGQDDRVHITNTSVFPWRAICSLEITAADGSRWIGTGWFTSPRTVVTAGHCVFMGSRGGWVRSIRVIPGRSGMVQPYGSVVGSQLRSVRGWTEQGQRTHDYGAIVLPAGLAPGNSVGWFGFTNLSDASLDQLTVNLSGYPGDKPTGTQWFHSLRIKHVDPSVLTYDIDTAGGQSGAPVWRLLDGQRHVIGIHTNGATSGNSATRITQPVFDNMTRWKTEGA